MGHSASTSAFVELFGEQLLTKEGLKPTDSVLSGKSAIGVYFSGKGDDGFLKRYGEWNRKLAKMYSETFSSKGIEIVYVSGDLNEEDFNVCYGEMPWVALPYEKRELGDGEGKREAVLQKKYDLVHDTPSLAILGPDCKLQTNDGLYAVESDPKGENYPSKYPWAPPTVAEKAKAVRDICGPDLELAAGKAIGLFFSRQNAGCGISIPWEQELAEFYKDGLKDKMEIFYVSGDFDQKHFDEYFAEMPWRALPYKGHGREAPEYKKMMELLGVKGFPWLAVLNNDGTLITTNGSVKVMKDPKGENLPDGWLDEPFNDINDDSGDLSNDKCVIALGADEAMCAAVRAVAEEYFQEAGKEICKMPFRFYSGPDSDNSCVSRLRSAIKIEEGSKLVLLNFSDGYAFYICANDASTPESVREFLDDFKANKLERCHM